VDSESAWRTGPSTRHWTAWTSRRHSLHPPTRRLILRRIASLYPRPKQLSWIGHGPVEKCRWAMTLWYPKRRIFWRNFHLYIPSNQCWIRITSLLAAMGSPPRAAWYACAIFLENPQTDGKQKLFVAIVMTRRVNIAPGSVANLGGFPLDLAVFNWKKRGKLKNGG